MASQNSCAGFLGFGPLPLPPFPGFLLRLIGLAGFRVWVSKVTNPLPGEPTKIVTKNYGATVVVGKPIPLKDLPADIHEATEALRQALQVEIDKARVK